MLPCAQFRSMPRGLGKLWPQITRYTSQRRCPRKTAGGRLSLALSLVRWGLFLSPGYEGFHTLPSHHFHHPISSKMPFKSFSLRQRRRGSPRPATSDNQSQARKYYLGTSPISFSYRSWPGDATTSDTALHVDVHDDIAMNAIQTSLAVLMTGSSLASELPFIAPIAGLLLQALTMRDARIPYISFNNVLTCASLGSKAIQRGMRDSNAQTRQNREDHCRFV